MTSKKVKYSEYGTWSFIYAGILIIPLILLYLRNDEWIPFLGLSFNRIGMISLLGIGICVYVVLGAISWIILWIQKK